jgi:hypothetical protein
VFWPFTPPEREVTQDLHHDWPPSSLPLAVTGLGYSIVLPNKAKVNIPEHSRQYKMFALTNFFL